jgi:hypothetical protein
MVPATEKQRSVLETSDDSQAAIAAGVYVVMAILSLFIGLLLFTQRPKTVNVTQFLRILFVLVKL